MYTYRISKYPPTKRDDRDCFLEEDWTSYSDIGKKFKGTILTGDLYFSVEKKYVNALVTALKENKVTQLAVCGLEKSFSISELDRSFKNVGIPFKQVESSFVEKIKNGIQLDLDGIGRAIGLALRECFWCELRSRTSHIKLSFGYDYYVYTEGIFISDDLVSKFALEGIYVERMA